MIGARRATLAALAALMLILGVLTPSSGAQDPSDPAPPPLLGNTSQPAKGDFPAVVYLEMEFEGATSSALDNTTSSCTGTLIHAMWVLTAAHCLQSDTFASPQYALEVTMWIGAVDILDEIINGPNPGTEVHTSSRFILHGNYDPDFFTNDVAMVKLPTASAITPQAIATDASLVTASNGSSLPAQTFGFGQICALHRPPGSPCDPGTGGTTDFVLRTGSTVIRSDADAIAFMGFGVPPALQDKTFFTIPDTTLHGGLCFGDSGGPTMVMQNGSLRVAGVNSHIYTGTFGDCDAISGTEYVNGLADIVGSNLKSWVSQVINPPSKPCFSRTPHIVGTTFADTIVGSPDSDIYSGNGGADLIIGRAAGDFLCGNGGSDFIEGGTDGDKIKGNSGVDFLFGDTGPDTIKGGSGGDLIQGNGGADRIQGGSGGDDIAGNGGPDIIDGNGGKDLIEGGAKADVISGGGKDDTIKGNGGADQLKGNKGDDTLRGGGGNDSLAGGSGTDDCNGGAGSNTFTNCE